MDKQELPAATRVRRVSVNKLTQGEKEDLEAKGADLSGEFVDVDLTEREAPKRVDPKAEKRAKIAEQLQSPVESTAPQDELPDPEPTAEESDKVEQLTSRIQELEKELEEKAESCPRCGWELEQELEIVPTDEDRVQFIESVCSGQQFKREYELFGGNVRFEFHTKEVVVVEGIGRAVKDLVRMEVLTTAEEMVYVTNLLSYITAISYIEMSGERLALPPLDPESNDFYDKARESIKMFPEMVSYAVKEKYREFEALVNHLTANADNPKYWRGIND